MIEEVETHALEDEIGQLNIEASAYLKNLSAFKIPFNLMTKC